MPLILGSRRAMDRQLGRAEPEASWQKAQEAVEQRYKEPMMVEP